MRNTEQLLRSLGLLAHEIGSLTECNGALKKYGPENFKGQNHSQVKTRTADSCKQKQYFCFFFFWLVGI